MILSSHIHPRFQDFRSWNSLALPWMGMGTGLHIDICLYLYLSYLWRRQRHNSWPNGRHSMSSGKAWHLPTTCKIYCCHNFFNQWFRDFIQIILFKQRVVFLPVFLLSAWCSLRCFLMPLPIHISAILHTQIPRFPIIKVVPQSGSLSIRHAVFTVVNIFIWQSIHKGLLLQKTCLRVFNKPYWRFKVIYYLNSFQNNFVRFINFSDTSCFRYAVFNTGRRRPHKIKVSWWILPIIPFQYVTINVSIFQVQWHHFPMKFFRNSSHWPSSTK